MACYTIYKGIRYNSTEDLKKALLKEHSLDNIFQKRFKSLPIDLKLQKIGVVKTISSDNSNKGQSVKPKNYVSSLDTKTTDTVFKPKEYKEEYKDVDLPVSINKELKKVLDELSSISKNINIVGEAVVDLLQGKTPKNLNFEVYGTDLAKLKKVLSKFGEVKDYGSSYGMLVLKISDLKYEFSIPRQDIKTGKGITGYEIKVNPNLSINEASQRRGFTLNGMSYNPITKTLYDPHNGLKDLHEGVLKHINDQAFYDNPTLVLELMQLQSITGHKIDDTTLDLIKLMITDGRMSELNKSKVYSEWKNWAINGKYHSLLFDFLRNSGLDQVYPEFRDLAYTPQDEVYHPEGNVEEHTMQVLAKASEIADRENLDDTQREILIFAALLHDIAKPETTKAEWSEKQGRTKITSKGHEAGGVKPTEKFLNKIGLKDTNTIETIKALVREHLAHASISSITEEGGKKSAFAKLVKRLNPATVEQLLLLMEADMMGRNNANSEIPLTIQEFKRLLDNYKLENSGKLGFTPILKGSHLISFGITQGPLFGAILKKAKEAQLNIEFETEAEAVEWLGTYLADNNYLPKDFTDNKTRIEDQIETYDKKITKTEVEKNPDKVYLTEDGSLKDHSNVIVMNLENGENVTNNQTNNTQQKTKLFDSTDKELKKGSVVEYNNKKYLLWNINSSGKAQLINIDGTKFSGTPNIDKLTVLGSYKTTTYNNTEYIVTDNNNIYSVATGNLVYTGEDNSSEVQKERIINNAKKSLKSNIVNSGNYSSNDVIFVSIGGKRGNEVIRKQQQDKTIKEAIKALEAGATLITDNAAYVESNSYNEGEKRLAANLKAKGYNYSETIVDGNVLGVWNKNTNQITPQQKQQAQRLYSEYLDSLDTIELHSKLGNKTESGNVTVVKNIFTNKDNKDVITAFRVDKKLGLLESFRKYNAIGNPINWQGFKPRFEGDNATIAFMDWFLGKDYTDVEQEYRQEILNNLDNLKGKTIEYYKELGRPSHATALDYLINQLGSKQDIEQFKSWLKNNQSNIQYQKQQVQQSNITVKPEVQELFESNPELANAVYEALGFGKESDLSEKNIFTVEPIQSVDKKAKAKAKIATQYIGFAEGISGSSTALYAKQISEQKTKLFNPNDKTLKKGSVVEYYGQKYLFWNLNDSGKAQLIKTDGTKFPGTPKIDKLIVLGSYKTTKYNGTEYIVTDNNNVYSGATGNLVYTSQDNSSIVQKNRIIEQAKNENLNNQTNNTQQEKTLTNNQRKHDPDYDSLINNNTKGYSRVKIAIGKDKFAYVMGKTVILEGFEDYEFFVHKNEGGIYEIIEKSTGRSLPTSPVGDYESITAVTKATLNALKDIGKQKFVETVNKTDKIESNINEISSNNIQQSTTTNNLDNNNKLFQEVESILRSGKTIVVPAVLQSTHPNLAQHITQVVSTIQNEENNKIEAPCKGGASI